MEPIAIQIGSKGFDYTLIATVSIAVVGWIIAILIQRKNVEDQIKYDIYKQIIEHYNSLQKSLVSLSVLYPPTLSMRTHLIGVGIGYPKPLKEKHIAIAEGWKEWQKFISDLIEVQNVYSDNVLKFFNFIDNWEGVFPDLINTKNLLFKEIFGERGGGINEKISKNLTRLISPTFDGDNGVGVKYDWSEWTPEEKKRIDDVCEDIRERANEVVCYSLDFFVLLYNKLLVGFFGKNKKYRCPNDPNYKVLIKDRFVYKQEIESMNKEPSRN